MSMILWVILCYITKYYTNYIYILGIITIHVGLLFDDYRLLYYILVQCGAPKIAKLVYNLNNFGLSYL